MKRFKLTISASDTDVDGQSSAWSDRFWFAKSPNGNLGRPA